jgi:putative tryptophan/tyrosine transport system substrate-binding protein
MRRRIFLALMGGAAAWPTVAGAQPAAAPVVGFLHFAAAAGLAHIVEVLRQGVKDAGVDVMIEPRWAEGRFDRLPALAAELVERRVAVIVAGGHSAALAAKAAARTTPIVFLTGGDPVADGLVGSLSRPGSSATGMSVFTSAITAKRLELIREFAPSAALIAVLINPKNPTTGPELQILHAAARAMGQELLILEAGSPQAIDEAFATLVQRRAGALLVGADGDFLSGRDRLIALAARHAVPAVYHAREFAASGGLISYGTDISDAYRQMAGYVARILQGTSPADLPVLQPTKFELVINRKTAKALGLTISRVLLAMANQVIE